jgi:hypothetical protein
VGRSVPAVKISDKVQGLGMGSPFPIGPALTDGVYLNPVVLVAACKFDDTSGIVCNGLKCSLVAVMAPLDYLRIGL